MNLRSFALSSAVAFSLSGNFVAADPFGHHHHHEGLSKPELLEVIKTQQCTIEQLKENREWREWKIKAQYSILCGAGGVVLGYFLSKVS